MKGAPSLIPLLCCAALLSSAPVAGTETVASERSAPAMVDRLLDQVARSLASRCLSPDVGRSMSDVVASGALQPVLGSDLTLVKGDVRAHEIALEMRDTEQAYVVTLALPGTKAGTADGQGQRFEFYLSPSATQNARVSAALLATAALFDTAIPDTAIIACAGGGGDQSQGDRRYPRALALASAAAEMLIVLVAVVFSLRAIREPEDPGNEDRGGSSATRS